MGGQINPKIVGASVIGFALVAGAYTISNFGESNFPEQPQTTAILQATTPQQRVYIEVTDDDQNGIEDWRDAFVDNSSIIVAPQLDKDYVAPDTLTGKTGVDFIEGIINSKVYGPFAGSKEEVIEETVVSLEEVAAYKTLNIKDIDVIEEWNEEDIVNYANTVAATIYRYSEPDLQNELQLVNSILRENATEKMPELERKALVYQNLFEDTLKIPVPKILSKEHLDMLNSFKAIAEDVSAFTKIIDDPLYAFVYIKRYSDDISSMQLSMQNIYFFLAESDAPFTAEDPALLFNVFSPEYQPKY